MTNRIWILGASDPEMQAIETLLRECGEQVVYAVDARGARVAPSSAYRATDAVDEAGAVVDLAGSQVYFVECAIPGVTGTVIDHHRPGDPGYGRPPSDYFAASSIGQVVSALGLAILYGYRDDAVRILADHEGGRAIEASWSGVGDIPAAGGGVFRSVLPGAQEWPYGKWGLWDGVDLPAHMDRALEGIDASEVLMTAAADHCLGAAYQGKCPGVDPDALMRWRAATRAQFQGRSVEAILADVERAREALRGATSLRLAEGAPEARDMRGYGVYRHTTVLVTPYVEGATCDASGTGDSSTLVVGRNLPTGAWDEGSHHTFVSRVRDDVPELPEAACVEGLAYLALVRERDGRTKVVLGGCATPEMVRAFLEVWAPAQGLLDLYGDPARGFAGGYVAEDK
jgi:hypothetical protein